MKNDFKNILFKRVILILNLLIFVASTVSAILCLFDNAVGLTVLLCSSYVLYPLILITFAAACILKAVNFKDYRLNFVLFIANLPVSFLVLLVCLYKVAEGLQGF